jgi:lysophospholipase
LVTVETADGVSLRTASWIPDGERARGTVLLMQGRAEFIEKYAETVAELLARGFAVVAFDWRGQGLSSRGLPDARKGHIAEFALYRRDVEAVYAHCIAPALPGPAIGLAHSMGGCIALTGIRDGWLPVRRLVALAPMIDLKMVRHPRSARLLIWLLRSAGLGRRFVPSGRGESISTLPFLGNRLSGDLARYERNAALARLLGPGAIGAPTIDWLAAAYATMDRFKDPAFASGITLPVLVAAAGDDPVCSTPAIAAFTRRLENGRLVVIPGARHEILMERDAIRAAFWLAFDAFVAEEVMPSAREPAQHDFVQAGVATGHD